MPITHLQQTASLLLTHSSPVAMPLGTPVAITSVHNIESAGNLESGVWECTPGRWRRQVMQPEFCHFIQGRGTFIPDVGAPIEIQAGDALLFPANSSGVWDITETVRKSYVLIG